MENIFETLNTINVSGKTEKKNGLTYLSWAYAWGELCKVYPTATYKVHERDTQWGPCNYFTDGRTAWVKVSVTIGDLTHTEMLPIMDYRNKSIPLDKVTSCDANKAIQRCITKAVARFGLGLYVYAGEDLPSSVEYSDPIQAQPVQPQAPALQQAPVKDTRPVTAEMVDIIRKIVGEHGVKGDFIDFICESYKVCKLEDLRIYQFNHIKQNIEKLKTMFDAKRKKRLADITVDPAAVKPKDMGTTFADVIAPPQQEKAEGEDVSLESLGLSPADLDALTECGNVFN